MKTEETKQGCAFTFDGYGYFEGLNRCNRLARQHGFRFCRVTGLQGMEEVLDGMRKYAAFLAVDETCDGATLEHQGRYYKRRVYTVFLLKRYNTGSMGAHKQAIDVCRTLFDQICKRLLRDRETLEQTGVLLNTGRIHFREMEQFLLSGCAGVYFMIDVDEPLDLSYEQDEWEE